MEKADCGFLNGVKWTLEITAETCHFDIYRIHLLFDDSSEFTFPDFFRVCSKVSPVDKNFSTYQSAISYVNAFEEGFSYGRKEN